MTTPIQLEKYDNSWYQPGGTLLKRTAWFFLGRPVLRSAWIPFSSVRVYLLRLFGARIGEGVVIKPSVDVKYPWHFIAGDHCWIGEHVWIDNLTTVHLGSNVCVSQGAYFCTGNHDWSDPQFGLRVGGVQIGDGAWVGAKAVLTPGIVIGPGAVAAAGAVVTGPIPAFEVYAGNPARFTKKRTLKASSPGPSDGVPSSTLADQQTSSSTGADEAYVQALAAPFSELTKGQEVFADAPLGVRLEDNALQQTPTTFASTTPEHARV